MMTMVRRECIRYLLRNMRLGVQPSIYETRQDEAMREGIERDEAGRKKGPRHNC